MACIAVEELRVDVLRTRWRRGTDAVWGGKLENRQNGQISILGRIEDEQLRSNGRSRFLTIMLLSENESIKSSSITSKYYHRVPYLIDVAEQSPLSWYGIGFGIGLTVDYIDHDHPKCNMQTLALLDMSDERWTIHQDVSKRKSIDFYVVSTKRNLRKTRDEGRDEYQERLPLLLELEPPDMLILLATLASCLSLSASLVARSMA